MMMLIHPLRRFIFIFPPYSVIPPASREVMAIPSLFAYLSRYKSTQYLHPCSFSYSLSSFALMTKSIASGVPTSPMELSAMNLSFSSYWAYFFLRKSTCCSAPSVYIAKIAQARVMRSPASENLISAFIPRNSRYSRVPARENMHPHRFVRSPPPHESLSLWSFVRLRSNVASICWSWTRFPSERWQKSEHLLLPHPDAKAERDHERDAEDGLKG